MAEPTVKPASTPEKVSSSPQTRKTLIEKLDNVINVGRPAFGQDEGNISIFKLMPNGEAIRTNVKLGRSSVNTIEIKEGLQPGDQVILSDMSAQDSFDRIRIAG